MSQHYDDPKRDCRTCTGYTFPHGCANFCDLFEEDIDLDPSESRGESICDNCLTASGHCPGQFECEKWLTRIGANRKPVDLNDMDARTIGFHLLDSDSN